MKNMKKNLGKLREGFTVFMTALALFGMVAIFASCGDDSDDNSSTPSENPENPSNPNTPSDTPSGSVSITFNENDGTESPATVTKSLAITASLPTAEELEFSRSGYNFVGWGASATATAEQIVSSDYPAQLYSQSKTSATVYAIWSDGSDVSGSDEVYIGDIVLADGTIVSPENYTADASNPAVGIIALFKKDSSWDDYYGNADNAYMIGLTQGKDLAWSVDDVGIDYSLTGEDGMSLFYSLRTDIKNTDNAAYYIRLDALETSDFSLFKNGDTAWAIVQKTKKDGYHNNFQAFEYAENYGTAQSIIGTYASGWYVPSVAEVFKVFKAYSDDEYEGAPSTEGKHGIWKSTLTTLGAEGLSGKYGVSSLTLTTEYTYCVDFDEGRVNAPYSKSGTYFYGSPIGDSTKVSVSDTNNIIVMRSVK